MVLKPYSKPVNDPIVDILTDAQIAWIAKHHHTGSDIGETMPIDRYLGIRREFRAFVEDVKITEFHASPTIGRIEYAHGQPYASAEDMREAVEQSHVLRISVDNNTDEFLGEETNLAFRAAHDMHHIRSGHCNFELWGEVCAYAKFASYTRVPFFHSILFSEIVSQVCYLRVFGHFPDQKIVLPSTSIVAQVNAAYGI